MAAQALYRRWRPQTFEDVIGQAHITQTLSNAVSGDRLAHAYLFTGPRGTGKTSVARILAKAVNCTAEPGVTRPCNRCALCVAVTEGRTLDLIEIDAASNTGVDDVRDLRDKIGFRPNEARYKVYIVDEAHMLSTAAFNALLKTLEEPPPHAIFVLATTEPHKVPDTIVSRCQRHDFRRVGLETVVDKLVRICEAEGAVAERDALAIVARSATGSIRDAESLLDQLISAGQTVTVAEVQAVLGSTADATVVQLVDAMLDRDAGRALAAVHAALDHGADPRQIQRQLLGRLRELLLLQTGIDPELLDATAERLGGLRDQAARIAPAALVAAIHRFNDARPAADRALPSLPIELAVVETVLSLVGTEAVGPAQVGEQPRAAEPAGPSPVAGRPTDADRPIGADRPAVGSGVVSTAVDPATAEPGGSSVPVDLARLEAAWDAFVAAVEQRDRNTGALLKDCRPVAADATAVTLGFFYDFHCKRMSEPARRALATEALGAVLGATPAIRCTVVPPSRDEQGARPRSKTDQAKADPVVRHALDSLGAQIAGIQQVADGEA